jgi:hypothetical protein
MRTQEYIARNLQGFEGDESLANEIKEATQGIDICVETGTYLGGTTKRFSQMFKKVHTIEFLPENFEKAKQHLQGCENVIQYLGDSAKTLPTVMKRIRAEKCFFFLDAHWQNDCPLIDELNVIAQSNKKGIIAIHDWKVPNTDLGFDSYNGQDFTIEWIKPTLDKCFAKYRIWYNDANKAKGARRGVLFIEI